MSYINAKPIHDHTSTSYAAHLREIRNHWHRLRTKRKAEEAARKAEYKPAPKAYNFRFNDKGTPILTIRKRKPPYLYRSEWNELIEQYPNAKAAIQSVLAKRSITIKPDPVK